MMSSPKPLQRIFEAVPPRYDLVNRIFTLGMDRGWRRRAVEACLAGNPSKILDVCCGTADLSLEISANLKSPALIAGLDYSVPMLQKATAKQDKKQGLEKVNFIHGDASRLPFRDGSLDCVGISFAFRNLTYKNPLTASHLQEVNRVLAKGGRYVIVESSQPGSPLINRLFKIYCRVFVYWTGYLISGNKGAYKYLAESAANFYTPAQVADLLMQAGFRKVDYRPLFLGAAGIHIAYK
jgi:demethylmenaquinone methyltransferase / 2-methoxy-6-polyprenyl-1,4-benzoquinol methylase